MSLVLPKRYDKVFDEQEWYSFEINALREVIQARTNEVLALQKDLRATQHKLWIANEQLKCVRMHTDDKTNELMSLRRVVANWRAPDELPL